MITPWDEDYKRTKAIVAKRKKLPSFFAELANWISEKYQVKVLNIEYELVIPDNDPRLLVVVETEEEELKFRNGILGYYYVLRQKAVAEKFKELVRNQQQHEFKLDRLFVVFTNFEKIAREDANLSIPDKKIDQLQKKLNNERLWKISRSFFTVTFFFYTDKQAQAAEKDGLRQTYTAKYYEILKPYDQFDYVKPENLIVYFDSKENFDNNYQGSWFYYYR